MPKRRVLQLVFLSLAVAQFVSLLGDRLHQFSVVGMIGREAPGSSFELFQFAVFMYLPMLVLAPLAGAVVDRAHKVAVLVVTDMARGLIVLSVPAFYYATGSLYAFYTTALALSVANLFFAPAKSAVIPELFGRERLLHINSVLWGLGIAGTLCGFAAGGWLFDFRGWQWSFYADGASYLVSVIFLLPLFVLAGRARKTAPAEKPEPPTGILRAAALGFDAARRYKTVGYTLAIQAGAWGVLGVLYVAGIAHLQETLPQGRTLYLSAVASAATLGLLGGSGVTTWVGQRIQPGRVIGTATILLGIACTGIALSESVTAQSLWALVLGAATSPLFVLTETLLQVETPLEFRGRVFALREVATKVLFLVASSLATAAGGVFDKSLIILIVGVFLAGTGLLLGRSAFPKM